MRVRRESTGIIADAQPWKSHGAVALPLDVSTRLAEGEAMLTGNLTAVAGSCGPGSLHFINGLVDANRNRAPVILIATQVASEEIGFNFPQEVDFKAIYGSCSVFCDMIITPEQARRKTVIACQTAIAKGGVAVLIVPVDIAHADASDNVPYSVHTNVPVVRPKITETTALGAAYAAGLAVGYWRNREDLVGNWAVDKRWKPQMAESRRSALFSSWQKAVGRSLDWIE